MKNLVVCCDGTWNTPDDHDGGVPTPTNVVRTYNAIARTAAADNEQLRYYHPGVGTDGTWWDKLVGGGTGHGLDRNIMSAYRWLCDRYSAGDKIYLFGFSRGAYTVRSLAGMIGRCGLLKTSGLAEGDLWQRIERLFQKGYRRRIESRESPAWSKFAFHEGGKPAPIAFLGVWDTVGALGIPDDMAVLNLLDGLEDYTFHDTTLGAHIKVARHAVALDEMRASFQPTLWTDLAAGRDVKQMWFPGAHSDVGGGYRETGLSDGALKWMIDEAAAAGLAFNAAMLEQVRPNHLDVAHESCSGVFALLPTQPRSAPKLVADNQVHKSALDRQANPPIHQCPYREEATPRPEPPLGLTIYARQDWNRTGVWLEAGRKYTFEANGEWMDASIKCGPDGTSDGHFQLGEIAHVGGSILGKTEELWKKVTGNKVADFKFTKRVEEFPWFCLVGCIANGDGVDSKHHLIPNEMFAIGTAKQVYVPRKSGYLYAFANDAWNCYGNNRGSVELRVAQVQI